MKKLFITLLLVLTFLFVFAACDKGSDLTDNPHVHSYGKWNTIKEASCVEEGTRVRSCDCNEQERETIPATGHSFGEWIVDEEATCVTTGTQHHICEVCGTSVSKTYSDATAHNYATEWTNDDEKHWHACQNDGCTSTSDKTVHIFGEWVIDVIDSCVQAGVRHHVCTVCDKSVSESYADSSAHNYATTWTNDDTHHWNKCQNSGCTSVSDKTAHTFGEWIVDEAATCVKSGTRHHVCTVCNKSVSETYSDTNAHNYSTAWTNDDANHWHQCRNSGCASVSSKSEHNFGEWVVDRIATCVSAGVRHHVCKTCSKSISENYVDLTAHNYVNAWSSAGAYHYRECLNLGCEAQEKEGHAWESNNSCNTCQETYIDKNLIFSLKDGTYVVTDYKGTASEVFIPSKYKGVDVTAIGVSAFEKCNNLTAVNIPRSITLISQKAFYECINLSSIVIGNNVTTIGPSAFYNTDCYKDVSNWENGVLYIGKYLIKADATLQGTYKIKDGTLCIGASAFYGCKSLESVIIPESVTSIGYQAFYECTALTNIIIPNGVQRLGGSGFYGCHNLSSIALGNNITGIESHTFDGCYKLSAVLLPDSVTVIDDFAFYRCMNLQSIVMSDNVTGIGWNAFSGCSKLESIDIGSEVKKIDSSAFENCTNLKNVIFSKNSKLTQIGANAFSGCKTLSTIIIPDAVTSIQYSAFEDCESLTSVTLGDSLVDIGFNAFSNCKALTTITISQNLKSIGSNAFSNCTSLVLINFNGTKAEWNAIQKGSSWNTKTAEYQICCSNGTLRK